MDESDTPLMGMMGGKPLALGGGMLSLTGPILGMISDITREAGGSGVAAFDLAEQMAQTQQRDKQRGEEDDQTLLLRTRQRMNAFSFLPRGFQKPLLGLLGMFGK